MSFTAYATDYYSNQQLASGETNIPRYGAVGSGAALVSGSVHLSYFTAQKSEIVNNIFSNCANVAAGATPTLCRMGWYSVDVNGNLILVGACGSDTTLWANTFTFNSRPLLASFFKQAGQRYASAAICISAAAMPALSGYNGTMVMNQIPPRVTGILNGQADLPASIPAGSVAGSTQGYFGGVSP